MPTNKTKVSRLFFIDCMRGFGGIYVAVHHILVMTPNIIAPKWLEPFIGNGYTGVTLFFIVSAFTLSYTLQKQKNTTHYKGKFFSGEFSELYHFIISGL